ALGIANSEPIGTVPEYLLLLVSSLRAGQTHPFLSDSSGRPSASTWGILRSATSWVRMSPMRWLIDEARAPSLSPSENRSVSTTRVEVHSVSLILVAA